MTQDGAALPSTVTLDVYWQLPLLPLAQVITRSSAEPILYAIQPFVTSIEYPCPVFTDTVDDVQLGVHADGSIRSTVNSSVNEESIAEPHGPYCTYTVYCPASLVVDVSSLMTLSPVVVHRFV